MMLRFELCETFSSQQQQWWILLELMYDHVLHRNVHLLTGIIVTKQTEVQSLFEPRDLQSMVSTATTPHNRLSKAKVQRTSCCNISYPICAVKLCNEDSRVSRQDFQ